MCERSVARAAHKFLGHKDVKTIMIYTISSTMDRVAFAIQSMDFEVYAEVYHAEQFIHCSV